MKVFSVTNWMGRKNVLIFTKTMPEDWKVDLDGSVFEALFSKFHLV